jgi:hypothetical protein
MINPLRPAWAALRDVFDEIALLLACNLIWCLLSLPLLWVAYVLLTAGALAPAALALLAAVLPAGPATAAMAHVAVRVCEGRATRVGEYLGAMRRYARRGWALLGAWALGLLISLAGIGLSLGMGGLAGTIILGLWIYLLLAWLALLIYTFPLMALQEQLSLRQIARGAALMVIGRPIYPALTRALMLLALWPSLLTLLPLLAISVALLNVWSARATLALIDDADRRRKAAQPEEPPPAEERGRKGQVRPK